MLDRRCLPAVIGRYPENQMGLSLPVIGTSAIPAGPVSTILLRRCQQARGCSVKRVRHEPVDLMRPRGGERIVDVRTVANCHPDRL